MLVSSKEDCISSDISSSSSSMSPPSACFCSPFRSGSRNEEGRAKRLRREPPARVAESSESSGADKVEEKQRLGDAVARSLFWVLRRGEAVEEEAERREDEVEDSLDGWREDT